MTCPGTGCGSRRCCQSGDCCHVSLRNPVVQPPPPDSGEDRPQPQVPSTTGPEVPQPGTGETAIRQEAPNSSPRADLSAPNAAFPQGPIEFRWEGIHDALFYELKVVSAEGDLVWNQEPKDHRTLPPVEPSTRHEILCLG